MAALVRHLSEEEELREIGAPRGLLLTGRPGTGKTFLVDLWLNHLPVEKKFRRHYHHLLLHIYRLIWIEAEKRRLLAEGQGGSRPTVHPQRGVGSIWERMEGGKDPSPSSESRRQRKSVTDWKQTFRGLPFFRSQGSEVPVSSFDNASVDDDGNKGMDVIKLAQLDRQEESSAGSQTTLPMHVAAQLFLKFGHVLVLDELQLLDIASATLLRRILTSYWRLGGVVVATSNRVPEDLYANNVQRRSLVAFLGALKERCPVVEIGGRDWRIERWKDGWDRFAIRGEKDDHSTFFLKGISQEERACRELVNKLIAGRENVPTVLKVYNRNVAVPCAYRASKTHPGVAIFTFSQLCDQPLGAADYLTLAASFETIVLKDVTALDLVHRNQARRLITLIDCLYESKCKLIIQSQVPLTKIFFAREGAAIARENDKRKRQAAGEDTSEIDSVNEDLLQSSALIQSETLSEAMQDTEEGFRPNIVAYGPIVEDDHRPEPGRESKRQRQERDQARSSMRNLSIFSGEEERFAYQRAVSRLWEMSHSTWQQTKWTPLVESDLRAWRQDSPSLRDEHEKALQALRAGAIAASASHPSDTHHTDFADEASYAKEGKMGVERQNKMQGPPVLSEAHIWGVREDWGPRAGKWGQGVRGLRQADENQDVESPRERRTRLRQERQRSPTQ